MPSCDNCQKDRPCVHNRYYEGVGDFAGCHECTHNPYSRFPPECDDCREAELELVEILIGPEDATSDTKPYYHAAAVAMIAHGGSFASALGQLYLCGDPTNQFRVRSTFPSLFARYAAIATHTADARKATADVQ